MESLGSRKDDTVSMDGLINPDPKASGLGFAQYCKAQRNYAWKRSARETSNTAAMLLPPAILYAAVVAAESSVCFGRAATLTYRSPGVTAVGSAFTAWADALAACRAAAHIGGAGALAVSHPSAGALQASQRRQVC